MKKSEFTSLFYDFFSSIIEAAPVGHPGDNSCARQLGAVQEEHQTDGQRGDGADYLGGMAVAGQHGGESNGAYHG